MSLPECIGCRARKELGFCPPARKRSGVSIILNDKPTLTPRRLDQAEVLLQGMKQDIYRYNCSRKVAKTKQFLHRRVSRLRTRMFRTGRVQQVPEMQY